MLRRFARQVMHTLERRRPPASPPPPPDMEPWALEICRSVRPFTMTSLERTYALLQAVGYLERAGLPGAIAECGVWRGGSMMAAALMLRRLGRLDRDLYLYDTYAGMPAPDEHDVSVSGERAAQEFSRTRTGDNSSEWCLASLEDVRANLLSTGYPPERMHFIKGKVEDTIPGTMPEQLALLRLDTDWYASTRHELEQLYPRLQRGGVLIIDDYGFWQGSRKAVDEYLEQQGIALLLNRVDQAGRVAIKP